MSRPDSGRAGSVFRSGGSAKQIRPRGRASAGLLVAALLCLGLLALPASATDSGAESEGWGYALAHELMSPFCPGRTLAACTSGQATELRQWILLQEAAGASREEVVGILEQRFGDVIRSRPEARGWGLAAWLLPAAAAILGGGVVAFALRRVVVKPVASAPAGDGDAAAAASEDLEFERLVDEELAARDS